jgi:hypothetical protein
MRSALLLALVSACAPGVDDFIGYWEPIADRSTVTTECGTGNTTVPLAGVFHIDHGTTLDLVATGLGWVERPTCGFELDVMDDTARATSGNCTWVAEMNSTGMILKSVSVTQLVFVLSGDELTITNTGTLTTSSTGSFGDSVTTCRLVVAGVARAR